MAAFHLGGQTTDSAGALTAVLKAPMGRALIIAMGAGLLGYGVWRVVEGTLDPERRGTGGKALAVRTSFVVRGLAHALFAVSTLKLAFGNGSGPASGGDQGRDATRTAFQLPAGTWIVWAVAIGIAGYGVYQLYRAAAAKLSEQLDTGEMSRGAGRWVIVASRFGIAARGIVFIVIGWLLTRAARAGDASQAGGFGEALQVVREFGRWPLAALAVGLIAYGVYNLMNAKYRRIRAR